MPEQETRNPQRIVYGIIPPNTFKQLILEAGILVTDFDPATGTYNGFIGATSGGVSFKSNPNGVDFGEDVDNAPANTMQFRRRIHYDPVLSGTLVSLGAAALQGLIGAADIADLTSATNTANADVTGLSPSPSTAPVTSLKRITPSEDILSGDFIPDLWLVADYTNDHNPGTGAGCVAIHLMNAFNTTGLQIQTQKNKKGTLPFEFHAFYDADNITAVPFEIYERNGPIYNVTAGNSGNTTT